MLHRVEDLDASASVEASGFEQPEVAVFGVVSGVVDWFGEDVDLLLDVWILPGHVWFELGEEGEGEVVLLGLVLAGVVFLEELEEGLEVVLAVLVIKI